MMLASDPQIDKNMRGFILKRWDLRRARHCLYSFPSRVPSSVQHKESQDEQKVKWQKLMEASSRVGYQRAELLTQHANVHSNSCLAPERYTHWGESKAVVV